MKYKCNVVAYNEPGGFGMAWQGRVDLVIFASTEKEAIEKAEKVIERKWYKVEDMVEEK